MYKIALVNMKGGVGKTTLAVNLADVLARREDKRVLIVDLDPQFNATQCLLSGEDYVSRREAGGDTIVSIFNEAEHQAINAVSGIKKTPAKKLEDVSPWKIKKNLDLIPGDLELHRLDMGGGAGPRVATEALPLEDSGQLRLRYNRHPTNALSLDDQCATGV